MAEVLVIGAGLAGSECAWQLAQRGIQVRLMEMKPHRMSPAHVSPNFAELVCSNSLRSDELTNAVGLKRFAIIPISLWSMKKLCLSPQKGKWSLLPVL